MAKPREYNRGVLRGRRLKSSRDATIGPSPAQPRPQPGKYIANGTDVRLPRHLEFFSLGGVLATFWKPRTPILPWIGTTVVLILMSCWDAFRGFGRVDLIVMGLAGYELTIGLTEDVR